MNKLDEIFQKERPTIMVPRNEDLSPCPVRKVRFLMGKWGLYLETVQPWGHLIRQLWESPRPLPYGEVYEIDTFQVALSDIYALGLFRQILADAAEYARKGKEWIGWVACDQNNAGEYVYTAPAFSSTRTSLQYDAKRQKDQSLVIDIHSHGTIKPFFSDEDNADDKGGVKIAIVLGNFRDDEEQPKFTYVYRYCVEGMFFNIPVGENEEREVA